MRKPKAQTLSAEKENGEPNGSPPAPGKKDRTDRQRSQTGKSARAPKAFAPDRAVETTPPPDRQDERGNIPLPPEQMLQPPRRRNLALRLALWTGGLLVSLGLGLMADRLIRDLFTRYEWLGWTGSIALALFMLALAILAIREISALRSLKNLDSLRDEARKTLVSDMPEQGARVTRQLEQLYRNRADMARARQAFRQQVRDQIDGAGQVQAAERCFMEPLDARARALTAATARRVAIVTAISPRAIVDIAFVIYESVKLARAIAALYGARPGLFGSWRLAGAILSHLAVTGGVALGDSVIQQLLGHGLAAKLSARLGEGLVNGLMSVRVGIAAMRVTRPLPFDQLKQPQVMDFAADLVNVTGQENRHE